jgi:hypothetical protein
MKTLTLALLLFLSARAAVIERPKFLSSKYDAKNGLLVCNIKAPPFKILNFYRSDKVEDCGDVNKSHYLGSFYFVDEVEEVSFQVDGNLGFFWIGL